LGASLASSSSGVSRFLNALGSSLMDSHARSLSRVFRAGFGAASSGEAELHSLALVSCFDGRALAWQPLIEPCRVNLALEKRVVRLGHNGISVHSAASAAASAASAADQDAGACSIPAVLVMRTYFILCVSFGLARQLRIRPSTA
jgi:hypothetical protein